MLEKNDEKMYFDAHFHFPYCIEYGIPSFFRGTSCAHSEEEWKIQLEKAPASIILAYGIHPQSCGFSDLKINAFFLQNLLDEKAAGRESRLAAIGEAGFDYFSPEFKKHIDIQEEAWNIQLELAKKYDLPLIVHCRKANHKLFEYSKDLKKLPSVLFHSFMGPYLEAESLIKQGVNAFFSFGKQVMNNNKKVIECVQNLPIENLLLETDAPYQFLKNESFTKPEEILSVYKAAISLRKESESIFMKHLELNYKKMFKTS
ncbi:MAG: TatD family hydrolase [Treponema sp.]|nr:TatD family hydrolase [Treponema sp.]